ncbi:MAG: Gfo/Idh/MocA family oxidoreductase [Gallionellaceae bacterium]|jgi:predicted dehydrogenase
MKKIVIIGAGQLGSRHLQALSKIRFPVQIEVVDTIPASLETAKIRFEEMPNNLNVRAVKYLTSIQQLSKNIDFAIIATNADVRADVVRALLRLCDVQNILLEKVLFQKPDDYLQIYELLQEKNVKAWVNHPRRQFPFYKQLKNQLAGSKQISYQLQGGGWGLACNGLHMIDHLAFLSGESTLEISGAGLNPSIIQSKRKGFVEFSGALHGQVGHHPFSLYCHQELSPETITICSDNLNVIVDEANGWIRFASKENGWKWEEKKERIISYQSELTNLVAEDVLNSGKCDLPTYDEAVKLHLPFIRCLMRHIEQVENNKHDLCPIT